MYEKLQKALKPTPTLKAVGSIPVGQTMKSLVFTPFAEYVNGVSFLLKADIDNKLTTTH